MQAAQDLFYRKGYLATSVDEILTTAGISKSNLYYHFKSKEELGLGVLENRTEDIRVMFISTLSNTDILPRERVLRYLNLLVDMQTHHLGKMGCPLGNLVAEMAEHSELFRCKLNKLFEDMNKTLADLIHEGQITGEFRKDASAEEIAALIIQTVQGMHLLVKCTKCMDDFRKTAALLLLLISDQPVRV